MALSLQDIVLPGDGKASTYTAFSYVAGQSVVEVTKGSKKFVDLGKYPGPFLSLASATRLDNVGKNPVFRYNGTDHHDDQIPFVTLSTILNGGDTHDIATGDTQINGYGRVVVDFTQAAGYKGPNTIELDLEEFGQTGLALPVGAFITASDKAVVVVGDLTNGATLDAQFTPTNNGTSDPGTITPADGGVSGSSSLGVNSWQGIIKLEENDGDTAILESSKIGGHALTLEANETLTVLSGWANVSYSNV